MREKPIKWIFFSVSGYFFSWFFSTFLLNSVKKKSTERVTASYASSKRKWEWTRCWSIVRSLLYSVLNKKKKESKIKKWTDEMKWKKNASISMHWIPDDEFTGKKISVKCRGYEKIVWLSDAFILCKMWMRIFF